MKSIYAHWRKVLEDINPDFMESYIKFKEIRMICEISVL